MTQTTAAKLADPLTPEELAKIAKFERPVYVPQVKVETPKDEPTKERSLEDLFGS